MADATREIPYPGMDITTVRRYANARANVSSVRQLALQIGMKHTTVDKFLRGSSPYARNRILLCEWFLREHERHPVSEWMDVPLQVESPAAHLDALLCELQGDAEAETRLRITTALAHGYRRMGLPTPEWLYRPR
jgi:hypothetical protein